MKRNSITKAKKSFRKLIDQVKAGQSVLITDRGNPVARLEPVTGAADIDDTGRLVRDGVVRPSRGPGLPKSFFIEPPPRVKGGESIVDILIEERREGR
ncbi:MAG TPA: type II toxin-antitoxin system prevent-host-death family antitoxin [Pseudolabrys sp.]|nr:type II toxin-antitoxin system prevent-host-death family antitoxin [Pseudolabrys sp.]